MSRLMRSWVIVLTTFFMASFLSVAPASADGEGSWPETIGPVMDRCGKSQDQYWIPEIVYPSGLSYTDEHGVYLKDGDWNSTGGDNEVIVTVKDWAVEGAPEHTYEPMYFGTEADSTCVEAPDSVVLPKQSEMECQSNSGTRMTIGYTNGLFGDPERETGRWVTNPMIFLSRWDAKVSSMFTIVEGNVADGESAYITGGDDWEGTTTFWVSPGTYRVMFKNDQTDWVTHTATLFVPACGSLDVPKGDPMGGPIYGRVKLGKCDDHKAKLRVNGLGATAATRVRLIVNPKVGPTRKRYVTAEAGARKITTVRKLKKGTVVKVRHHGETLIKRKLKRC